jgi:hypothetical protein
VDGKVIRIWYHPGNTGGSELSREPFFMTTCIDRALRDAEPPHELLLQH